MPKKNVVLYSAPPNAVFTQSATAKGVLGVRGGTVALYPLSPSQKNTRDFVLQKPTAQLPRGVQVSNYVDIWQGKQMVRWVELKNPQANTILGWAKWGNATRPSSVFTQTR
ncbi:hypothetical protein [Pseudaestuariivita rosea]|uniref:hypothetical protein n=1 Tax=Pseudaestuariivita rosea TaxID=2763263 RepID=UPI001ABB8765|nr:hypothetical protein [Pseudaestuariivita rosea]